MRATMMPGFSTPTLKITTQPGEACSVLVAAYMRCLAWVALLAWSLVEAATGAVCCTQVTVPNREESNFTNALTYYSQLLRQ